jgi:hypothetical protein
MTLGKMRRYLDRQPSVKCGSIGVAIQEDPMVRRFVAHRFNVARLAGLLAVLVAIGCSVSSPYMTPLATPAAIKADGDKATIVFVRPSGLGGALKQTIFDDKGRFLGEALPNGRFSVQVPPGDHMFVVWAENTGVLKAKVEAGKIYFVEVSLSMGAFSAQANLVGVRKGTEAWQDLDEWLAETKDFQVDEARGQQYLASRKEEVDERIQRARENFNEYDAEEQAEHSIGVGDAR